MTVIDRGTLRTIALYYDREPLAVREQVAAWIRDAGGDSYAAGVADALLERVQPAPSRRTSRKVMN